MSHRGIGGWNAWRIEAGYPDLLMYELRHTQATLLINAGTNLQAVKSQMGHSSLAITSVYAHRDEDAQRALVGLLPTA